MAGRERLEGATGAAAALRIQKVWRGWRERKRLEGGSGWSDGLEHGPTGLPCVTCGELHAWRDLLTPQERTGGEEGSQCLPCRMIQAGVEPPPTATGTRSQPERRRPADFDLLHEERLRSIFDLLMVPLGTRVATWRTLLEPPTVAPSDPPHPPGFDSLEAAIGAATCSLPTSPRPGAPIPMATIDGLVREWELPQRERAVIAESSSASSRLEGMFEIPRPENTFWGSDTALVTYVRAAEGDDTPSDDSPRPTPPPRWFERGYQQAVVMPWGVEGVRPVTHPLAAHSGGTGPQGPAPVCGVPRPAGGEPQPAGEEPQLAGKEPQPAGEETLPFPGGRRQEPSAKSPLPQPFGAGPRPPVDAPAVRGEPRPAGGGPQPAGEEPQPAGEERQPAGEEQRAPMCDYLLQDGSHQFYENSGIGPPPTEASKIRWYPKTERDPHAEHSEDDEDYWRNLSGPDQTASLPISDPPVFVPQREPAAHAEPRRAEEGARSS